MRQTRSRGFAIDPGNYMASVTVIAAPVWESRAHLSHAIVAIDLTSAMKRKGLPQLQEAIRDAAKALSGHLCGEVPAGIQ